MLRSYLGLPLIVCIARLWARRPPSLSAMRRYTFDGACPSPSAHLRLHRTAPGVTERFGCLVTNTVAPSCRHYRSPVPPHPVDESSKAQPSDIGQ